MKLYPPTGFHPFDHRLWELYAYAEEKGLPVMSHCSRPASVQYRGNPTPEMQTGPVSGQPFNLPRYELLTCFTGLSNAGHVIGESNTTAGGDDHGYFWKPGVGMIDLGVDSVPNAVNSTDLIVGQMPTGGLVVWQPIAYTFDGFFPPVDNGGVFNVAKAGRVIPVKFDIGGDRGLDIFAAGFPKSTVIACSATAPRDVVEESTVGESSSLNYQFDAGKLVGNYTYLWKTDNAWAGTCRQLQLRLNDGSQYTANFQFSR